MERLGQLLRSLHAQLNQYIQSKQASYTIDYLIKLADYCDQNKLFDMANRVDNILKIIKEHGVKTDLISLANELDGMGLEKLADLVDTSACIIKRAEDYGFIPQIKKDVAEHIEIEPPHKVSLSTRYCPDHNGVQAIRVNDHVYQCPLDGKKYDYQLGYINYEGKRILGGSVAEQTPSQSNYGGVPMRTYDSRADTLNRIN